MGKGAWGGHRGLRDPMVQTRRGNRFGAFNPVPMAGWSWPGSQQPPPHPEALAHPSVELGAAQEAEPGSLWEAADFPL